MNKIFDNLIPDGYYNNLRDRFVHGGKLVELLARYGDVYLPKKRNQSPVEFDFPKALEYEKSCDMSFSGYQSKS